MAARSFDTGTDQLLCELADGVATITLNRPDKRNALSDELTPALRQTLLVVEAPIRKSAASSSRARGVPSVPVAMSRAWAAAAPGRPGRRLRWKTQCASCSTGRRR
jgi:hypothetical protein